MKKLTIIFATLLLALVSLPASAKDRIITLGELPVAAQHFVKDHFGTVQISYVKVDEEFFGKDYKVIFVDGSKVEFSKEGDWTEVDCRYRQLPLAIVPTPIRDYVARQFTGRKFVSIERDNRYYEVKLDNGLELKFDKEFRLVEVDD